MALGVHALYISGVVALLRLVHGVAGLADADHAAS
jgi:hypothetical protein